MTGQGDLIAGKPRHLDSLPNGFRMETCQSGLGTGPQQAGSACILRTDNLTFTWRHREEVRAAGTEFSENTLSGFTQKQQDS